MRPLLLGLGIGLILSNLALADETAELCVDGPSNIAITHLLGDLPKADVELIIIRCGSTDAPLNWTSSITGPAAAFVSLNPASGTILPGQGMEYVDPIHVGTSAAGVHPSGGAQPARLAVDIPSLVSGFFVGTLTIQNADLPANSVNIPLTMNVTSVNFTPGDTLVGDIDPGSDSDAAGFYGLKGMTLRLSVRKSTEVRKLRITVLDSSSAPLKSFVVKPNKNRNKQIVLKEHDFYLLRVESADGSTGAYEIKTNRTLPGNAKPRTFVKTVPGRSDPVRVKFAGLPGALVNINILPVMPLNIGDISLTSFQVPSGGTFNTDSFESDSLTGWHYVRIPLAEAGIFELELDGDTFKGMTL